MDSVKIYSVGGSVRDGVLGVLSSDEDFVVVGATHDYMLANGFQMVGADFPVYLDPEGREFALARTERKSGRGYTGFTVSTDAVTLEDDLLRRDLRINAIAKDMESGELIDPFNGLADLESKTLRHVSEAFADDPVRVLRLARFHARYGPEWTIAPETMEFCRKMVEDDELLFMTTERIVNEFEKALSEKYSHLFFKMLSDCGALEVVLPHLSHLPMECFVSDNPNPKVKYSMVMLNISNDVAREFECKLNIRSSFREFSRVFRRLHVMRDSNSHPIDQLYAVDAFRRSALWEALVLEVGDTVDLSVLNNAYQLTKSIGFNDLPAIVQMTLRGHEIHDAIKELRKSLVRVDTPQIL